METATKNTTELVWLMNSATIIKEHAECIEKKFTGKLPYRMVMNAILNNEWTCKSENNNYWTVSNTNSEHVQYGLHYSMKTGIVEFVIYQAI
jgi:hypothetical protein